jgi:invasion protein IalB
MALYTIPAGYTGYLLSMNISSGKDQEMEFKFIQRDNTIANAGFQTKQFLDVRGGQTTVIFNAINIIPQKSDIYVSGKGSSTSSASASFDLLLVQDGY